MKRKIPNCIKIDCVKLAERKKLTLRTIYK